MKTRRSLRAPWALAGIVVFAVTAAAVLLMLSGVRMLAIATPSMGTTAPVGTLVVTQPQAHYQAGDIISFTEDARTVTHRIVGDSALGFVTKGDLNGAPDGWRIKPSAIIGKAIWLLPGAGFLLRGLPWLLLGGFLVEGLARQRFLRMHGRWSVRLVGWALTVAMVGWWLRPWFNMELLNWRPADDGHGVLMHVVNTGLFPLSANGEHAALGQDVVARATDRLPNGAYALNPLPDLPLSWRVALVVLCLLPLLFAVLRGGSGPVPVPAGHRGALRVGIREGVVVLIAIGTVGVVIALSTLTSMAAFAATVRNSTNTVGTRTLFSCAPQTGDPLASSKRFVYAMGTGGTGTETDRTGNARTGAYQSTTAVSAVAPVACPRDAPAAAVTFNGSNQCLYAPGAVSAPNVFTLEAWFKTSTVGSGKIIGFGTSSNSAADSSYDRHVYLDPTGRVVFGVYPNALKVIATPAGTSYANGAWHHVVATLSTAGMALYVDGALVASNASVTTGEAQTGYWKVGCGNLAGWADGNGTAYNGPSYFTGQLRYTAVYTVALTAAQVTARYQAGTP